VAAADGVAPAEAAAGVGEIDEVGDGGDGDGDGAGAAGDGAGVAGDGAGAAGDGVGVAGDCSGGGVAGAGGSADAAAVIAVSAASAIIAPARGPGLRIGRTGDVRGLAGRHPESCGSPAAVTAAPPPGTATTMVAWP
jgi:streptogrisin D